jgi:hopanoid biosynthesis associated RND transporter like protein HpnN
MIRILDSFLKNPYKVVISFLFITFLAIFSTFQNLSINTSTDSLIDDRLKFKKNQKKLKKNFEVLNNNILIRIKGNNSKKIENIFLDIEKKLNQREEFDFFYSPNFDKFFKSNFFSLLSEKQKIDFVDQLYQFQPFISELNNNKKLEGFNNFIDLILKGQNTNEIKSLDIVFKNFILALNTRTEVDWKKILRKDLDEIFILLSVNDNYLDLNGFSLTYDFLKSLREKYNSQNVNIQFTGGLIIDHEEIKSVSSGAALSGLLSIILVSIILYASLKKIKLIFCLVVSILIGLFITTGITSVTIGSLNLISVAFAVLFIGLSVDFGIQVFLRILENQRENIGLENFKSELSSVSRTITIASIPSIVGFLSFVPTKYTGLSELGIISAIGLFVGLLVNILFLPAIYSLIKKSDSVIIERKKNKLWQRFSNLILSNKNYLLFTLLIISIYNFTFIKSISFDSDAMKLKDQKLQSVLLAKELIEKNPTSDYIISIVENKEIDSSKLKDLLNNSNIQEIRSLGTLFTEYKSENLDYLKFLITTGVSKEFYSSPKEFDRFQNLLIKIKNLKIDNISNISEELINKLSQIDANKKEIKNIEKLFFIKFNDLNNIILTIGNKKYKNYDEIPDYYKNRFESLDGFYRYEVIPSKDVTRKENLEEFVDSVQRFYPDATGMPVVQLEAGKIVKNSFIYAFIFSFIITFFYLLIIFKNLYKVLLCILSLLIALILLIFLMIVFKIDLNFANMISLPLLFSLGISYPIYFVTRLSEKGNVTSVFASNTPLAIFTSSLTTICSFGTLFFSSHQGTSSMGLLLFISLLTTLVSSLIFLPIISTFIKFR